MQAEFDTILVDTKISPNEIQTVTFTLDGKTTFADLSAEQVVKYCESLTVLNIFVGKSNLKHYDTLRIFNVDRIRYYSKSADIITIHFPNNSICFSVDKEAEPEIIEYLKEMQIEKIIIPRIPVISHLQSTSGIAG